MMMLGCAGLSGCVQGDPSIRDSEAVGEVPSSTDGWPRSLDLQPILRVGWDPGDVAWAEIADAAFLGEDRIGVIDRVAAHLVVLSDDLSVIDTVGRPGSGPGEFVEPHALVVLGDQEVGVQDVGTARFTSFRDGAVVLEMTSPVFADLTVFGATQDRNLWVGPPTNTVQMGLDIDWLSAPIVRVDPQARTADTIVAVDFAELSGSSVFPHQGHVAAIDTAVVVGRSDRRQLRWMDEAGNVMQEAALALEPPPVTDSVWSVYSRGIRTRVSLSDEALDEMLAESRQSAPNLLPLFGHLLGDPDGNVWVGEYAADYLHVPRYHVLSHGGDWLGEVEMPPRFQLLDVADDRLLGIQRNELGVEAVSVFRFGP